ncbi:DUF63 family protein [Halobacteriaceae archaeon GCM10025711]
MMVLPSGFALPPLPYLLVLLAATALVAWALRRDAPPVTGRTVVAFAPWMVVGSSLYVAYQVGLVPAAVRPFFGSPAVYLTTFVVAGIVWLTTRRVTTADRRVLAATGVVAVVAVAGAVLNAGLAAGTVALTWPLVGLVVATAVAGVTWSGARRVWPGSFETAGAAGALVVFAHALDGVSTAVGVDVLAFGEQTPLSRAIMEFAGSLPTASVVGVGWLFVVVKLGLALVVVALLTDYVHEDATRGFLLLGLVAAVGLGPGAHNLLLFAVSDPAAL